jgi:amphi-Trp domain-containing protein
VAAMKVQQQQALSRQEAAHFVRALADGLGDGGRVRVQLGTSTLAVSVASQLDCELDVSVDGDEIELELQLKWSVVGRSSSEAAPGEFETDRLEEIQPEDEAAVDQPEADPVGAGDSREAASEGGATDEGEASDGGSVDEAAVSAGGSVPAVAAQRTARPRRSRRKIPAKVGKPASNGVDTAAVRVWAAANGVSVSPRGRLKNEVIKGYRAGCI